MKTLVSFPALTLALAASLGVHGCGGDAKSNDDEEGGGTGGANTGGAVTETGGKTATGGKSSVAEPCEDPMPVLTSKGEPVGFERCARGGGHRASAEECAIRLPREEDTCTRENGGVNTCQSDAECVDGLYGICLHQPQSDACGCNYGCRKDEDCAGGGVCLCGELAGHCESATCRTDADCEDGYQCRSFQNPTSNLCDSQRFECQTADDTCQDNADCDQSAEELCVSDSTGAHHCKEMPCAVPGRPFWIDGEMRTASTSPRGDWAGEASLAEVGALSELDRAALADYFSRAALLEHASVAAFARFALELLHFGAPLQLVEGAHRAMGEELEHARLCFALASRYGGQSVGPGALDVRGCLEQLSLADAVRSAVREGCVGETVAAVQAAEAFEHAHDEAVKSALDRLRRDEWEHAQLSFQFVRWALELDPTLCRAVLDELRACAPPAPRKHPVNDAERQRAEHGLLPEAHLEAIAARVHAEVVSPLLSALVAGFASRGEVGLGAEPVGTDVDADYVGGGIDASRSLQRSSAPGYTYS